MIEIKAGNDAFLFFCFSVFVFAGYGYTQAPCDTTFTLAMYRSCGHRQHAAIHTHLYFINARYIQRWQYMCTSAGIWKICSQAHHTDQRMKRAPHSLLSLSDRLSMLRDITQLGRIFGDHHRKIHITNFSICLFSVFSARECETI